ncbi:secretin N-terminal domain-containing protein [Piscinibacter sp.]|uniref:secretin N-terminal domain-containing protein n=1 Tax=Piscinibacter sp. TaxID=1903157 RepID=UPI002C6BB6D9|nr:secretin N-terminal domain-containing protein [Albitalea sp.]HUG26457.1 secretin N-terminal domain-containing protein [Albitalea sp.]
MVARSDRTALVVRGRWSLVAASVLLGLAGAPLQAVQPATASAGRHAAAREPALVTLNFPDAEVEAITRAMSAMLERPIVADPRVKGRMTLYTEGGVTLAQAYAIYSAGLRGLGFAMVETNGLLKIVPEADAKLQAASAIADEPSAGRADQVVTRIFRLEYENANNLVTVLRPLITPNNTINVNSGNNTLVITDYAANVTRLGALIAALDTPSATDVEVMHLQHALATDLVATVQRMTEPLVANAGSAVATSSGSIVADTRANALLVRAANPTRLAAIRALVARLDRPGAAGIAGSNVHVIHLKNAEATRLASVLRAAFPGDAARSSGGTAPSGSSALTGSSNALPAAAAVNNAAGSAQAAAPVSAAAQPSLGGYIQADPATNSLIVTAPEPLYREISAVVAELDSRRAQLYVESLVVEVDASKALDVGLQWKTLFNLSSTSDLTLGTVAQAIESTSGTNILSTANLVTLDNEEAKIVVGQNVPFVTGQYTTTGSSSTNPFQTIERKDVGITLRIRPQIGENGTVRMTIFQESSSVSSSTSPGTSNAGPTTNKRSIESNVVVGDGKIIVLGGLIEEGVSHDWQQIPVVSGLPLLGSLFRTLSRSRKKTNLVVFLRPTVMRDDAAADTVTVDRYDRIRARQRAVAHHPGDPMAGVGDPLLPALGQAAESPGRHDTPVNDDAR